MAAKFASRVNPDEPNRSVPSSDPEPTELQLLQTAEHELSQILAAMKPLVDALPRLDQHYQWSQGRALQAPHPAAASPGDGGSAVLQSTEEFVLPQKAVLPAVQRPEVRLSALSSATPDPMQLAKEIDDFYRCFQALFEAAKRVNVGSEIRLRQVDHEPRFDEDVAPAAVLAKRALGRAIERNSLLQRYARVVALLRAVEERRKVVALWHTPEGRRELLASYCHKHGVSIDQIAERFACNRTSIYNWQACKGKGRSKIYRKLEQMLRADIWPPADARP